MITPVKLFIRIAILESIEVKKVSPITAMLPLIKDAIPDIAKAGSAKPFLPYDTRQES